MNCPKHGEVIPLSGCPLCAADQPKTSATGRSIEQRIRDAEWEPFVDGVAGSSRRRRHVEPSRDDEDVNQ